MSIASTGAISRIVFERVCPTLYLSKKSRVANQFNTFIEGGVPSRFIVNQPCQDYKIQS